MMMDSVSGDMVNYESSCGNLGLCLNHRLDYNLDILCIVNTMLNIGGKEYCCSIFST